MLTEIRDRSSGWFAWVIALLIIIPMTFWGVQEYVTSDTVPTLVTVGDQKVTQNHFNSQLDREQQYMRKMMGAEANNKILNSVGFKRNVLRKMMNRVILKQIAQEENYRIGDKQLEQLIKANPSFNIEGKFSQAAYDRYVAQSKVSKSRFEDKLREQTLSNQVISGYQESAIILPTELRRLLTAQMQRRTFDMVTLKQAEFKSAVTVSEADIQDYYQANQAQFLTTEKVSLDYLRVSKENLLSDIVVDEDQLLESYEQNKESYTTGERRQLRHILLAVSKTASAVETAAIKDKAQALIEQLKTGGDFSSLAKANSDDSSSAKKGGSLGLVERGQMVAEFDKVAFSLEQGQISEPIKTSFGFHIVQVEKIEASVQQPFAAVRSEIEQAELDQLGEERFIEVVEQLKNLAYEHPETLTVAAEELSLTIQHTDLFDRAGGKGIASNPAVRDIAFSEEVLIDGINSEPIQIADTDYVVIRKLDHQASKPKPLAEVRGLIEQLLISEKASALVKNKGEQLRLTAEKNWQALFADKSLTVESHDVSLADSNSKLSQEIVTQVNKLRIVGDKLPVSSLIDNQGNFHIIRLKSITTGNLSKISEQAKEKVRRLLQGRNGHVLLAIHVDKLIKETSSPINNDLL